MEHFYVIRQKYNRIQRFYVLNYVYTFSHNFVEVKKVAKDNKGSIDFITYSKANFVC